MIEVRPATRADIGASAAMLARAFEKDPVWRFIFPDASRPRRLRGMFDPLMQVYVGHAVAHVAVVDGGELPMGVALWGPPGHWRTSMREMLPHVPAMARAFGVRGLPKLMDLQRIEHLHEPYGRQPHHYLGVLGTDPAQQGKGVGSALLAHTLGEVDEQGLGAYLESSNDANVPFYGRHGFEVVGDYTFRGGGPTLKLMWRTPRV